MIVMIAIVPVGKYVLNKRRRRRRQWAAAVGSEIEN
jgi:hypothetical protein